MTKRAGPSETAARGRNGPNEERVIPEITLELMTEQEKESLRETADVPASLAQPVPRIPRGKP